MLIGSPHLEKFGNVLTNVMEAIPRPYMQLAGEVTNLRSSGIKDLRFVNLADEDWKDINPDALFENHRTDIPLYQGATYYVISRTITKDPESILSQWFGNALVRKGSALGKTKDGKDTLSIAPENQKEYPSVDHLGLGHSDEVYQQLRVRKRITYTNPI